MENNKFSTTEQKKKLSPIQVAFSQPVNQPGDICTEQTGFNYDAQEGQKNSGSVSEYNSKRGAQMEKHEGEEGFPKKSCPPNLNPIKKKGTKESKTQIAYYIDTNVYKSLSMFSAMYDVKKQDVTNEALRSYFEQHM